MKRWEERGGLSGARTVDPFFPLSPSGQARKASSSSFGTSPYFPLFFSHPEGEEEEEEAVSCTPFLHSSPSPSSDHHFLRRRSRQRKRFIEGPWLASFLPSSLSSSPPPFLSSSLIPSPPSPFPSPIGLLPPTNGLHAEGGEEEGEGRLLRQRGGRRRGRRRRRGAPFYWRPFRGERRKGEGQ